MGYRESNNSQNGGWNTGNNPQSGWNSGNSSQNGWLSWHLISTMMAMLVMLSQIFYKIHRPAVHGVMLLPYAHGRFIWHLATSKF